jgi:hypothetical protein
MDSSANIRRCALHRPSRYRGAKRQVQIMGIMYREAVAVLAWLGVANSQSELFNHTELYRGGRHSSFDEAIVDCWLRSYWTRLWIIQELILARGTAFVCGDKWYSISTSETFKWARKLSANEIQEMAKSSKLSTTQARRLHHASSHIIQKIVSD